MIEIIPSLLVSSKKEFEIKLRQVEQDVETVHVDILDGSLFENTTWFEAQDVGAMRTRVRYELHLMVENPLPIIAAWKKHVPTTARAIIHAEMNRQLGSIVDQIHDIYKLEACIALNPETPLEQEHPLIHQVEGLTIMGVHPGHSHDAFLGDFIFQKIKAAREHLPNMPIEIDGGVTLERLPKFLAAGATRICTASLLFSAKDPSAMLGELKHAIMSATK